MLPGFSHILPETRIYHLRIVPPEPIYSEIVGLKKRFITEFGKHKFSTSKPHITLAEFQMSSEYIQPILNCFYNLERGQQLHVKLDGFDCFRNPNILFINVEMNDQLKILKSEIQKLWQYNLFLKRSSINVVGQLHMTISSLESWNILQRSLDLFNYKNYAREFSTNKILLVSKLPKGPWDEHYEINL